MKKVLTLLLFCMTVYSAHAQQDLEDVEVQLPNGWSKPAKRKEVPVEAPKKRKDKKQKENVFQRDPQAAQPDWRRPQKPKIVADDDTVIVGTARYCLNMENFRKNNWRTIGEVTIKAHYNRDQHWLGSDNFRFECKDKGEADILRKEALLVVFDDSLYVNCRRLKTEKVSFGRGYARAYRYDGDKVCFIKEDVANARDNYIVGGQFGFIGSLLASGANATAAKNPNLYILTDNEKNVSMMQSSNVEALLIPHFDRDDLWKWYKGLKKKEKNKAVNVLLILEELNTLKPY